MQVNVNGDAMQLPDGATVSILIEHLALSGKRLAVEVNEDIVPRSRHAEFQLNDGDRVEVVHAIGGG
ncbi:sulfur carrier protein ThiS [Marinobacter santoriniensis NKSG1]|uniref:Sulfur carrier protein ThiS n=1 Tax=Marinobacter santoriniensis NKSG1 TaxID=1288826 RepID=M7DBN4_9GAMM|nr:sulfur carrier protein ThiS [Marinobacter santoriniensis]EMP55077.1 sulfur carrier protein ThiS [Marinobacter santoriniensis NKSG1]